MSNASETAPTTLTLTEFLLARIAEDEAHWRPLSERAAEPFAAFHRRMLAECEAKRRILSFGAAVQDDMERLAPAPLQVVVATRLASILALPYAEHPDYREEWRP